MVKVSESAGVRKLLLALLLLMLPAQSQDPEDATWAARIPIGPMQGGAHALPLANAPADPKPTRIFPSPTVFSQVTLYIWMSSTTFQVADYPGGPVSEKRSTTEWTFMPNGRFFCRSISYGSGGPPNKIEAWGRYTIGADGLAFETDGGEHATMVLAYGRRNLVWGDTTYGEVHWEQEALRRVQQGP